MHSVLTWLALVLCLTVMSDRVQAQTSKSANGQPSAKAGKLPPGFEDEIFSMAVAEQIADKCDRLYKVNEVAKETTFKRLDDILRKQGFNENNKFDFNGVFTNSLMRSKAQNLLSQTQSSRK